MVKESACNVGDMGSIPGSGRFPWRSNGNPLQYLCLQNPMDRGAWWTTVHGVERVGHNLATKPPLPPPGIYGLPWWLSGKESACQCRRHGFEPWVGKNTDDTTLMAESEEELKSLWMKVKDESEKVGLKLNIQKTKIMASSPITSWKIDGVVGENRFLCVNFVECNIMKSWFLRQHGWI